MVGHYQSAHQSLPDVRSHLLRNAMVFVLVALPFALMEETAMAETITAPAHGAARSGPVITLPDGFREVVRRQVMVDGIPAILTRHVPVDSDGIGLGGEHVSLLQGDENKLKGFVRLQRALTNGELPTEQAARQTALRFLEQAAPDLLDGMEVHWIARHDEKIAVSQGAKRSDAAIPGMKVKMRNTADGRWFWVIVGTDGGPIAFERDIVWITMPGHRQTEKWLHDSWLVAQGGGLSPS